MYFRWYTSIIIPVNQYICGEPAWGVIPGVIKCRKLIKKLDPGLARMGVPKVQIS